MRVHSTRGKYDTSHNSGGQVNDELSTLHRIYDIGGKKRAQTRIAVIHPRLYKQDEKQPTGSVWTGISVLNS